MATKLTPLSDPENVLFELVPDDTEPATTGFTNDEAYAFLTGADMNTFGVPQIIVADYDPMQHRDAHGRWVKTGQDFPAISIEDAEKMQSEMLQFNDKQSKTIRDYTGLSFKKVNAALRNPSLMSLFAQSTINTLRGVMRPTTQDMRVFRSTRVDNFGVTTPDELRNLVGKDFVDRGFTSTTIDPYTFVSTTKGSKSPHVRVYIDVPKGSSAAYVADVSHARHEQELLLNSGTKFHMNHVEVDGNDIQVWLSVVN